jgi:hypothetical protein
MPRNYLLEALKILYPGKNEAEIIDLATKIAKNKSSGHLSSRVRFGLVVAAVLIFEKVAPLRLWIANQAKKVIFPRTNKQKALDVIASNKHITNEELIDVIVKIASNNKQPVIIAVVTVFAAMSALGYYLIKRRDESWKKIARGREGQLTKVYDDRIKNIYEEANLMLEEVANNENKRKELLQVTSGGEFSKGLIASDDFKSKLDKRIKEREEQVDSIQLKAMNSEILQAIRDIDPNIYDQLDEEV